MFRLPLANRAVIMALAIVLSACGDDGSTPADLTPQFAKGGGNTVTVKSTDPSSARQGITLDVRVSGSGYDPGSRVSFALAGVPTSELVVNSTSFVSSTELIANVTIAADADTLLYDVVVLTTTGKKGIGSELFGVLGDPPATWLLPLDASGLSLASDGKYPTSDGFSAYADKTCGVNARIFATENSSNSGDAVIQSNNPKYANRKCAAYPRKATFTYLDGGAETVPLDGNLQNIQNTMYSIPIGQTVKRGLNLGVPRCGILRFKGITNTNELIAGDSVLVTRLDGSTWEVQSQAAPNNRVNCRDTGETFNLNVRFRVMSAWTLP